MRADLCGPGGITPLHLAALLPDARISLALLDSPECFGASCEAFTCLVSQDGVSPFHLAFQMGHFDVPVLLQVG